MGGFGPQSSQQLIANQLLSIHTSNHQLPLSEPNIDQILNIVSLPSITLQRRTIPQPDKSVEYAFNQTI